jgi:integrase
MANLPIFRRGGVFYWRRRIPRAVASIAARSHFCCSLQTTDRRQARMRALRLSLAFEEIMQEQARKISAGRAPTKAELDQLLVDLFARITEECETWAATRPRYLGAGGYASDEDYQSDQEAQHHLSGSPEVRERAWLHTMEEGDFDEAAHYLPAMLEERGLALDQSSNEFKILAWKCMKAGIAAFRRFQNISPDSVVEEIDALISGSASGAPARSGDFAAVIRALIDAGRGLAIHREDEAGGATSSEPLISSFIEKFVAQYRAEKRWTEQTKAQNCNSMDLLLRIVGDKAPRAYTRDDAETLRRTLEQIPVNFGKSPRHWKIPIKQVIAERKPNTKTLSKGTLNRHWNTITSFFGWVNRQDGIADINIDRIFGGFRWGGSVPGPRKRQMWDDDSLGRLFASPIWRGCKYYPEKRYWRHEPGKAIVRDEYFWLPILALYTGARLDELANLAGTDVQELKGVPVIYFHGEHLKTESSERYTPIHSILIRLGFLDLAKEAGSKRLFPDMKPNGRDKKLSHNYTEHFTQYRRNVGVYRPSMDFHSFRTTATTAALRGGCSILEADEITGHDSAQRKENKATQTTTLQYFRGFGPKLLQAAVEKITYPSIELERHFVR